MASIGRNDVSFDGINVMVYDLVVPDEVFASFISELDAEPAKIPQGSLNLKINGNNGQILLDDLLSYSGNKPGDCLLYFVFSQDVRDTVFNVEPMNGRDETRTGKLRVINGRKAIVVMIATYFFHGSIQLPSKGVGRNVKFAMDATKVPERSMSKSEFTNVDQFDKIKFRGLATNAMQVIKLSPPTFRSRARKGFGGNRVLSILIHLRRLGYNLTFEEIQLQFLSDPAILEGAPYVSLHPDHNVNPMQDTGKNLVKAIGNAMRNARIDIQTVTSKNKGLYIKPIVALMNEAYIINIDQLPDIDLLMHAISPDYSIPVNIVD